MPTPLKRSAAQRAADQRRRLKGRTAKSAAAMRRAAKAAAANTLVAPSRGQIAAVKRLFDRIPAPELIAALESTDDERAARLLTIMRDPAYRKVGMAMRIRAAGLSVSETLHTITAMYHSDAALRVARRIPAILEQMAVECQPHRVPCPKCASGASDFDIASGVADTLDGKPPKCGRCGGKKTVLIPGDNDVRKMVLENQNLAGSKAPLIDARSLHVHGAPDMTGWSRESDDALEKAVPRRIAAGSIVDTPPVGVEE